MAAYDCAYCPTLNESGKVEKAKHPGTMGRSGKTATLRPNCDACKKVIFLKREQNVWIEEFPERCKPKKSAAAEGLAPGVTAAEPAGEAPGSAAAPLAPTGGTRMEAPAARATTLPASSAPAARQVETEEEQAQAAAAAGVAQQRVTQAGAAAEEEEAAAAEEEDRFSDDGDGYNGGDSEACAIAGSLEFWQFDADADDAGLTGLSQQVHGNALTP